MINRGDFSFLPFVSHLLITSLQKNAVAAEIAERQRSGTEEASLSDEPSRTQRSESERSSKREHQPFARLDDALHGCCNAFARFKAAAMLLQDLN